MTLMKKLFILLFCMSNLWGGASALEIPKDLAATQSGLKYKILKKGSGDQVQLNKEVAFHWTGYFEDGTSFGTSAGGEPFYFITGKNQVIKGAEEGLALMREGDRYLFIMPSRLAYGSKGSGDTIPPNSTLIFEYEVISVAEPKMNIRDVLLDAIEKEGIQVAIKTYHTLRNSPVEKAKYSFRENELNNVGYKLLNKKLVEEAILIFALNIEVYPDSWNAYDSLAEAYYIKGDKQSSLQLYEKSVKLNPESKVGLKRIKELRQVLERQQ